MKLVKLTDSEGNTYRNTYWDVGVTHKVKWGGQLCEPGCIHAYTDLTLALFLNPIHASFDNPRAWLAEGEIKLNDNGLKVGVDTLTIIRELEIPIIATVNRVAFGILCAKSVYSEPSWLEWANDYLLDRDRSASAAAAARAAAAAAIDFITIAAEAMKVG